jgi:hypothetical protein
VSFTSWFCPDELILPAVDHVEIAVGQLPPLFFDFPPDLLPIAFELIPIHGLPSIVS